MAEGRKTRKAQEENLKGSISGLHIYKDERNRPVYYDVFSKTGYILSNNEARYKQYSMRFMMGIIGFILMMLFNMPILVDFAVGIAVYIFMEVKFRKFLKTLVRIENFKCDEKMKSQQSIKTLDTNKVVIKMILLIALSVLIIINAQNEGYTGWLLYLNYVISILSFIFALYHAKELISRKQNSQSKA